MMRPIAAAVLDGPSELRRHWHRAASTLGFAAAAVAGALPLALLAGPGLWRAMGIVYALIWAAAILPSMTVVWVLVLDAVLIIWAKRPLYLPTLLEAHRHRAELEALFEARRIYRWMRAYAGIAVYLNPLTNVALSALSVAFRVRPATAHALLDEHGSSESDGHIPPASIPPIARPTIELSEPFVERLSVMECGLQPA